jgi:hypothetical protein
MSFPWDADPTSHFVLPQFVRDLVLSACDGLLTLSCTLSSNSECMISSYESVMDADPISHLVLPQEVRDLVL